MAEKVPARGIENVSITDGAADAIAGGILTGALGMLSRRVAQGRLTLLDTRPRSPVPLSQVSLSHVHEAVAPRPGDTLDARMRDRLEWQQQKAELRRLRAVDPASLPSLGLSGDSVVLIREKRQDGSWEEHPVAIVDGSTLANQLARALASHVTRKGDTIEFVVRARGVGDPVERARMAVDLRCEVARAMSYPGGMVRDVARRAARLLLPELANDASAGGADAGEHIARCPPPPATQPIRDDAGEAVAMKRRRGGKRGPSAVPKVGLASTAAPTRAARLSEAAIWFGTTSKSLSLAIREGREPANRTADGRYIFDAERVECANPAMAKDGSHLPC